MTDLKLIDELLCDLKDRIEPPRYWERVETHSSATRKAMARLRQAWASGEMPVITLSLEEYFRLTKTAKAQRAPGRTTSRHKCF